ncbi:class I SAM-dependent methyltransferase [Streptomyces sp. NPDC101393]|uniref:class I SAM-dependent methyltransferase n=1 Tax=Streptomyces sp. NPDC101393 TaxID=3366141 RepID=UPI00380A3EDE
MSTDEQVPEEQPGFLADRHEDPYGRALRGGKGPLFLRRVDGGYLSSEMDRWCARADHADISVLRRCQGAVLDIGCGPGRLVAALNALGHLALGIDISRAAVLRAEGNGGAALCRSVFERLPGEGMWRTALLMDGNIGIGGDPAALLARIGALVTPLGSLLFVEAAADDIDERLEVRFEDGQGHAGTTFPWARVGVPALRRSAALAGWLPGEHWAVGDRHFVELRRSRRHRPDRGGDAVVSEA